MAKRFFNDICNVVEELLMQRKSESGHLTHEDEFFTIFKYSRSEREKLEEYLLNEIDEVKWEAVIIGAMGGIREIFEAHQFIHLLNDEELDNLYWKGLFACMREIKRLAEKYGLTPKGDFSGRIADSWYKTFKYIHNLYHGEDAKDEKENKDVRDDRQMAGEGHYRPQEAMKSSFRAIIQYHDKDGLIKRLHELIDEETSPAMVGAILLRASVFDGLIKRKPTRQEFDDEFHLFKYKNWQSVHNYMDEGSQKALAKANKIVIFE